MPAGVVKGSDKELVRRERRLRADIARMDALVKERQAVVRELLTRHSVRQVADMLGLHFSTVHKIAKRGR